VREAAVSILSKAIPPNAAEGQQTGLVVGYIQSGKTMSFETVAALARDNSFQVIIVIAGNLPAERPPRPLRICRACGASLNRGQNHCASCAIPVSRERFVEVARKGRVASHTHDAEARRSETQRRHAAEQKAWQPSQQPAWLDEKTYREKIQPRLAGITVPTISTALGISEPYATDIRAGKRRPHPLHWQTLARLVGVSPDR
jgi:hypothetical protein